MTPGIAIVVTGGRDYRDQRVIWRALDELHALYTIRSLGHGDNPGVRDKPGGPLIPGCDQIAGEWAETHGIPVRKYEVTKAEWDELGGAAGPIRNGAMLDAEDPDMLVRFKGGKGTRNCERQARRRHIFVHPVPE